MSVQNDLERVVLSEYKQEPPTTEESLAATERLAHRFRSSVRVATRRFFERDEYERLRAEELAKPIP